MRSVTRTKLTMQIAEDEAREKEFLAWTRSASEKEWRSFVEYAEALSDPKEMTSIARGSIERGEAPMASQVFKDYRPIIDELRRQDWVVDQTNGSHWQAKPPLATMAIVHFAVSDDPHALQNTIRDLRNQGFVWPIPSKNEQRSLNGEGRLVAGEVHAGDGAGTLEEGVGIPPAPEDGILFGRGAIQESEDAMDQVYRDLKEAKTYLLLAEEAWREAKRLEAQAAKTTADAVRELERARADFNKKRGVFDKALIATA